MLFSTLNKLRQLFVLCAVLPLISACIVTTESVDTHYRPSVAGYESEIRKIQIAEEIKKRQKERVLMASDLKLDNYDFSKIPTYKQDNIYTPTVEIRTNPIYSSLNNSEREIIKGDVFMQQPSSAAHHYQTTPNQPTIGNPQNIQKKQIYRLDKTYSPY